MKWLMSRKKLIGLIVLCCLHLVFTPIAMAEEWVRTTPNTYEFVVPKGVTELTVELWGGGGSGATRAGQSGLGGGGGGGAYARSVLSVTPEESYEVVVGQGSSTPGKGRDSYFGDPALVLASGGGSSGVNSSSGASGGAVSSSSGDVTRAGGSGSDGGRPFIVGHGGGGGSSAGPDAPGNDGNEENGGDAPAGGGDGGDGGTAFAASEEGAPGDEPGGGGGGAKRFGLGGPPTPGGPGGHGKARITYVIEEGPDHIRLIHDGEGLTCSPESITVRACANEGCTSEFSDPVDVELTSPESNWSPNPVTVEGSAEVQLQYTSAETVTLNAEAISPSTPGDTRCFSGGVETCEMIFRESGFLIDVPDHVAGNTVAGTIAAVRESDSSQACVPGFENETKDTQLWSGYSNPSSGTESVVVNGATIPAGSRGPTYPLSFDENGVADINLRYDDAGRVRLNARYEGTDPSDPDFGLVMTGTDEFVARPDHFNLLVPGNPAAADPSGDAFTEAGADFDIQVEAVNANGATTRNFGQESPAAEGVELQSALFAPSGGSAGSFQGSFNAFGTDCDVNARAGFACGTFRWSEAGILSLTPTLAGDGVYLGTQSVAGNQVDHVGRFIPDRFQVAVDDPGEVQPLCEADTAFLAMGEPMGWRTGMEPVLSITALSEAGTVTENYTANNGEFQYLSAGDIDRTFSASDDSALDENGDPFPVSASSLAGSLTRESAGVMHYTFHPADTITYLKKEPAPSDQVRPVRVSPFVPDYSVRIDAVEDSDNVSSPQTPLPVEPDFGGAEMRYARLVLENAYGPETQPLTLPFRSTYWNGSGFVLNDDDDCWDYTLPDDVTLDQSGLSGGSTTVASGTGPLVDGRPPSDGQLTLSAPGDGNRGEVVVEFSVPTWLKGDYNGDDTLTNPTGTATFGVYEGHDRVIYWREVGAP